VIARPSVPASRVAAKVALAVLAALAAAPLLVGVATLLARGLPALGRSLSGGSARVDAPEGAILAALAGTLGLSITALLVAAPIGVAAAVALSAPGPETPARRLARWGARELGGLPSVVVGLAGLVLFARGLGLGPSPLAAALTLAVLILPGIVASTEAALRAVPESLRDASLALGATHGQTLSRLVLPRALPQVRAGLIRAGARAAGATAPLIFVLGLRAPLAASATTSALPSDLYALALTRSPAATEAADATAVALVVLVLAAHAAAALAEPRAGRAS